MKAIVFKLVTVMLMAIAAHAQEGGEGGEGGGGATPDPDYRIAFISGDGENQLGNFTVVGAPAHPQAVWGAGMAYANTTGQLFVFGGEAASVHMSSETLFALDTYNITEGWIWVSGSQTLETHCTSGVCSFPAIGGTGNPPARYGHGLTFDPWRNSLWLFGGRDQSADGFWNDLWEFSIPSKLWYRRAGGTITNITRVSEGLSLDPGSRYAGAVFWKDGDIYVYGGSAATANGDPLTFSDMWKFTPEVGWSIVSELPGSLDMNLPAAPYVVGSLTYFVDDVFTIRNGTFADSVYGPFDERHPGGRFGFSWGYDEHAQMLWLFGGLSFADDLYRSEHINVAEDKTKPNNDVWSYHFPTGQWAWRSGTKSLGQDQTWDLSVVPGWKSKADLLNTCGYECFGTTSRLFFAAGSMSGTHDGRRRDFITYGGAKWDSHYSTFQTYGGMVSPVRGQGKFWAYNFTSLAFDEPVGYYDPYMSLQYNDGCEGGCSGSLTATYSNPGTLLTTNQMQPAFGSVMAFDVTRQGNWMYGGCHINSADVLYDPVNFPDQTPACTTNLWFISSQMYLDPCSNNPCQNGGTCSDALGGAFTCSCTGSYTGSTCETPIDSFPCNSSPCHHGAICVNSENATNGYECFCPNGYSGVHCETNVNECLSNP